MFIEDKNILLKDIIYDDTYKNFTDKRITLTKVNTKNYVKWDLSGKKYWSQQDRAYFKNGKICTLPKNNPSNKLNIVIDYEKDIYRKMHPIEGERCQTLPDNFTSIVSSHNKRLELCGNAWTVDIIVEFLKQMKMQDITVLSLFDGISCIQVALERAGVRTKQVFASEIDKYAIKVAQHNYPNTIQIGDINKVSYKDGTLFTEKGELNVGKIDLICGGFPCQSFSFAGKQLNFNDPRGKLFFELVRIKNEVQKENPELKFLFENVKMKKEFSDKINELIGVTPVLINSSLVSAQNRERNYWTNISNNIEQPKDRGLFLKDIIEDGGIDCRMTIEDKCYALTASYNGAVSWNSIERKQRTMILDAINGKKVHIDLFKEPPYSFYETRTEEGKEIRRRIRIETGRDSTPRSKEFKMYLPLKNQKANCLVTIESPLDFIVDRNWKYRKLHPIEMERLQTLPDGYTKIVSNYQARKMLGNGWTIDVICHILSYYK